MTDFLLIILVVAVLIYACRMSGFVLQPPRKFSWWPDYLRLVPVAIFSALTTMPLLQESEGIAFKLTALALAGVVMWKTQRLAVAVLLGLVTLWLLDAL